MFNRNHQQRPKETKNCYRNQQNHCPIHSPKITQHQSPKNFFRHNQQNLRQTKNNITNHQHIFALMESHPQNTNQENTTKTFLTHEDLVAYRMVLVEKVLEDERKRKQWEMERRLKPKEVRKK